MIKIENGIDIDSIIEQADRDQEIITNLLNNNSNFVYYDVYLEEFVGKYSAFSTFLAVSNTSNDRSYEFYKKRLLERIGNYNKLFLVHTDVLDLRSAYVGNITYKDIDHLGLKINEINFDRFLNNSTLQNIHKEVLDILCEDNLFEDSLFTPRVSSVFAFESLTSNLESAKIISEYVNKQDLITFLENYTIDNDHRLEATTLKYINIFNVAKSIDALPEKIELFNSSISGLLTIEDKYLHLIDKNNANILITDFDREKLLSIKQDHPESKLFYYLFNEKEYKTFKDEFNFEPSPITGSISPIKIVK